jgi:hypothetical protein
MPTLGSVNRLDNLRQTLGPREHAERVEIIPNRAQTGQEPLGEVSVDPPG